MLKPVLIYDGDCDFCQHCVDYLKIKTNDQVEYIPYQENTFGLSLSECKTTIHLIEVDKSILTGAAAGLKALNYKPYSFGWWLYKNIPGLATVFEVLYRWIANNRRFMQKITKVFFKK